MSNTTHFEKTLASLRREHSTAVARVAQLNTAISAIEPFAQNGNGASNGAPSNGASARADDGEHATVGTGATAPTPKRRGPKPGAKRRAPKAEKKAAAARGAGGGSSRAWPRKGSTGERLLEVVTGEPQTAKELAVACDAGESTIFPVLRQALERGLITKGDDGYAKADAK